MSDDDKEPPAEDSPPDRLPPPRENRPDLSESVKKSRDPDASDQRDQS